MTKPRSVADTANDNSIPGSRIEDGSITQDKLSPTVEFPLADDSVSTDKIQDGAVTESKIQDGSVSQVKLASGVTLPIADDSIYDVKINDDAAIAASKLSYTAPYGSSPTARTALSKFSDVASVIDFGADPTGVEDSTAAVQNAVNSGRHVFVPTGTYRIDGTIVFSDNQSMELGQKAFLTRKSADSSNTDPVVWVRGSSVAIYGSGMTNCGFSSGNRAPYGVLRIGFANMKFDPNPQPNVTYNSFHNFRVWGATLYGPTTLDPETGQPDSCIFICNPQFFGRAVYFQDISGIHMRGANIGLWLCGWANGNTISNIHGVFLGNTSTAPYNCFIYDNGSLDNTISNSFFHASPNSQGLRVEKFDNTAEGGSVHRQFATSYRGMVFEQGGSGALGLVAIDTDGSFYEIRHNCAGGNFFEPGFFDKNFMFGLASPYGSNNQLVSGTYRQSRRESVNTDTGSGRLAYEEYFSYSGLTEATAYDIGTVNVLNGQRGAMIEVEFGVGAGASINYQGGGKFIFVITRNAGQIISSTVVLSRYVGGVVPQKPILDLNPFGGAKIIFRVGNNGTGTSVFSVQGVVRVVGGGASISLNSTPTVYTDPTVALSPTL